MKHFISLVLLALLVLLSAYYSELHIYNTSIKPVLEHAKFISIPGKKYIKKELSEESLLLYSGTTLIHSKQHINIDEAISCRDKLNTDCFISVKAAEFKGKQNYWEHYIIKGHLPSANNEIAINDMLSKRIKLDIGDKAGVFTDKVFDEHYEEKTIKGIIKNPYFFPDFCMLNNNECMTHYGYRERDLYFVFGVDMQTPLVAYSFSDNNENAWIDVKDWLNKTYKKTLYEYSVLFFIISLIANLIALFCINKATSFRQRCNKLIMLGKNRKEVLAEKFNHYVFFICLCLLISLLISPWQNWHLFIVNVIAAIAAVSINILFGKKI